MNTQHRMLVAPVYLIAGALMLSAAPAWSGAPDDAALRRADCRQGDRGRLIRFEQVASFPTADDVRAHFLEWIAFYQSFYNFPADLPETFQYGFDAYKVTYCTDDAVLPGQRVARTTIASGLVAVPRKSGPLPTVAYVRGTAVSFYDTPSNPNIVGPLSSRGESFEGPPSSAVFAGNGFLYIAPDDLGFGDSTVPRHRYFHAKTEASAAIDLLAAAQPVLAALRVRQDGRLFVFGWSQGGHAALALQRELERIHVRVAGTAVVGAIPDPERWFFTSLTSDWITRPLYATYLLLAYDDVYDVYASTSDVFRPHYAGIVEDLFDMKHFFDDVMFELPPPGWKILTPSFLARLLTNPNEPFRVRLRENAVDTGWNPRAPIHVFQSDTDEEAPFDDELVSVDRLRRNGATIDLHVFHGLDHANSWIQTMPRAIQWFRSIE
jgi:pimeloyl-ACP methyl ester carboxylesterase